MADIVGVIYKNRLNFDPIFYKLVENYLAIVKHRGRVEIVHDAHGIRIVGKFYGDQVVEKLLK